MLEGRSPPRTGTGQDWGGHDGFSVWMAFSDEGRLTGTRNLYHSHKFDTRIWKIRQRSTIFGTCRNAQIQIAAGGVPLKSVPRLRAEDLRLWF